MTEMVLFAKIANVFRSLTSYAGKNVLDVKIPQYLPRQTFKNLDPKDFL